MTYYRRLVATCLLLVWGFAMPASAQTKLVLTGSSTIAPLALEIAKRFEKLNPDMRVDVQSGGSSRGIADVRSGAAHIGMASRELKADEADLMAVPIAKDGITIILNRLNPVASLSDDQIKAIYTGRIVNWRALGGPDRPITVVNKAEGRSTLELFLAHFKLKSRDIKAHTVIGENQQGIKTVAGNPNAIAYVSIGTAESETRLGSPIKLLPMAGVAATVAHVRDGSYPLARRLNLVVLPKHNEVSKRFLSFAQSAAVHDLVREQFFVPLSIK